MKNIMNKDETIVGIIIVILSIAIGIANPVFLSIGTIIDTTRAMLVIIMFALCEMIVIISGGTDVSFPAVASFSMFTTTTLMIAWDIDNIVVAFIVAGGIGIVLGAINAVLVGYFQIPTLIATLGTSALYSGALLSFVGVNEITNIPKSMDQLSKMYLFSVESSSGIKSSMSVLIILPIILCIVVWFVLKYTMLGRSIYAIGGDVVSAQRAGFNVMKTQFFIYIFVGFIAGIAGITYTILMRNSNPVNLMGSEMMVIAAVVIGGTRITGGQGSVLGTILGVILITIVSNNLILLGIPNYWQKFFMGVLIVLGTTITSLRAKKIALSPRI